MMHGGNWKLIPYTALIKTAALTVSIFKKVTFDQSNHTQICYADFYPNRQSSGRFSFTP
jgi:hypothetical protein